MKKALKIFAYIVVGLLLLILGVIGFFNGQYNKAAEEMQVRQAALPETPEPFYRFEIRNDSLSELDILPLPKNFQWDKGSLSWNAGFKVSSELPRAEAWVDRLLPGESKANNTDVEIRLKKKEGLGSEAYQLQIRPGGIDISYQSEAGAYYAMVTLYHLKQQFPESINSLSIEDKPDLEVRGLMLDISRDKVPQLHTLKQLVDQLSLLKYNHLQLYVEGFSFGYESFKDLWQDNETPVTPEEIQELDAYCKERFIELVPNQNSLGHMQAWLETEAYAHLAECPDGYELMPMNKVKTTLDPTNPESIALIEKMMDDLLPNFSSGIFNANLDEPFELGHCNSAELAEEVGIGKVYLDQVLKVYELSKSRGKSMWMWGDIIGKHPELLDEMPKDITVLEWGYEQEHPFDANTARIKDQGLEFLVCPGTSSWMTLTGRTDNMLGNIQNAVLSGIKNGAKGMLLTDWGDLGHWQYLPVSFPGFAYAGAISWNSKTSQSLPLERYLNTHLFEDDNQELAGIAMKLGRSYHYEERHLPNMSHNFLAYQFGMVDPVLEQAIYGAMEQKLPELVGDSLFRIFSDRFDNQGSFQVEALNRHLDALEASLNVRSDEINLATNEEMQSSEIRNEMRNGLQMVRLGAEIRNYGQNKDNWNTEQRIEHLSGMQSRLADIKEEHRRLWLLRNKSGGLDRSMKAFEKLEVQLNDLLEAERKGGLSKKMNRLKEKVISGGVHWYLN
ncbi:beta-N-acetylhexosaminidase [Poritiphilus flavus]|uniref:beta-N-acetylhexosaminidase n=1 Tax=Poritiphilus flavus TaxID=2697053 RepID=A0A6L9EEX5_9FLAO|nr:family 20 glycosylhydrolase [Poritiphilus flavus]NAS13287.1 family 20 glycosylhydrolase [Poritiphilus flavus]